MDTEYLKKQLGDNLVVCLSEVSLKRPQDPIEYIAQWLYKHIENQQFEKQNVLDAENLVKEKDDFEKEQERQETMRLEKEKFAKEEQERKKAEQAAKEAAEGLAPVQENEEEVTGAEEEEEATGQEENKEEEGQDQAAEADGTEQAAEAEEGEEGEPTAAEDAVPPAEDAPAEDEEQKAE